MGVFYTANSVAGLPGHQTGLAVGLIGVHFPGKKASAVDSVRVFSTASHS